MFSKTNFELADSQACFIHDLAYDYFGNRVATCSSDQKIKIWQKSGTGKWTPACAFKAHESTIFKVKWAHPDFGSILASCSYDRSVIIWEEKGKGPNRNRSGFREDEESSSSIFIERAKLIDNKESIEDIKFGPKHLGLILASASADGYIRIYTAPDLTNISEWKRIHEIRVNTLGINSISWNKNPTEPPMIAVAAKDSNTSFMNKKGITTEYIPQMNVDNVSPINEDKLVLVYVLRENTWNLLGELKSEEKCHKNAVNDVSWAILNGRSFHMVASCGKDGVFIWYIKIENKETKDISLSVIGTQLINNNVTVWKVSWNILATLLAYSGQDGKVRICKCGYDRKWQVSAEFEEEEFEEDYPKLIKGEDRILLLSLNPK